jgi:hypothetical protein
MRAMVERVIFGILDVSRVAERVQTRHGIRDHDSNFIVSSIPLATSKSVRAPLSAPPAIAVPLVASMAIVPRLTEFQSCRSPSNADLRCRLQRDF